VNMDFGGGHSEGGFDWSGLFDGRCFKRSFWLQENQTQSVILNIFILNWYMQFPTVKYDAHISMCCKI